MREKHLVAISRDISIATKASILLLATSIKDMTVDDLMPMLADMTKSDSGKIQTLAARIGINTEVGAAHIALAIVGTLNMIAQTCFITETDAQRESVCRSFVHGIANMIQDMNHQKNTNVIELLTPKGIVDTDGNILKFTGRSVNPEKA